MRPLKAKQKNTTFEHPNPYEALQPVEDEMPQCDGEVAYLKERNSNESMGRRTTKKRKKKQQQLRTIKPTTADDDDGWVATANGDDDELQCGACDEGTFINNDSCTSHCHCRDCADHDSESAASSARRQTACWTRSCGDRQAIGCLSKARPNTGIDGTKTIAGIKAHHKGDSPWALVTVTIDSGAAESVMPADVCSMFPVVDTEASKNGEHYVSASGDPIYNEGERRVTLQMDDATTQGMLFQVCDVDKVLASVARICSAGHTVTFRNGGGEIAHDKTGKTTKMKERHGVYVVEAWANRSPGFQRPA